MSLKELIILIIVSFSSLFLMGFAVHMLIGGLVSESTERWAILVACAIGLVVVGLIVGDIIRQRRRH